jgi:tRNA threonylcarbamoyladenosine modification (KEOPS) complex Cgi121 subunit
VLKRIDEFGKCVEIVGFKNVKIDNTEEFLKKVCSENLSVTAFQFFDARLVATWEHLYFAALNALTAFRNKANISRTLAMEIILYASAQGQIRKAMELIGIKRTSSEIGVLIIGVDSRAVQSAISTISKCIDGQRDDGVLELSKQKSAIIQEKFEISDVEIKTIKEKGDFEKALVDLVIERMALLATER